MERRRPSPILTDLSAELDVYEPVLHVLGCIRQKRLFVSECHDGNQIARYARLLQLSRY